MRPRAFRNASDAGAACGSTALSAGPIGRTADAGTVSVLPQSMKATSKAGRPGSPGAVASTCAAPRLWPLQTQTLRDEVQHDRLNSAATLTAKRMGG